MIYLNLYCYLIFIPMVIYTNLASLSMMSWFSMWMNMEINMINFIMLLIFDKMNNMKITLNYFMIQTFNSYLFLFSSFLLSYSEFYSCLMMISMITKLGMPPFHYWYIKIFKSLSWNNIFYISTFQKIIPLSVISSIINLLNSMDFNLLMITILCFMTIYSMMGINIIKMKMILAYSSIIQMSWIISLMIISESTSFTYFFIYLIIMFNILFMFKKTKIISLSDLTKTHFDKKKIMLIMMSILSLASLPPYFGFLMKWISINMMIYKHSIYMIIILILNSLTSMYFYMRMVNYSIFKYSMSNKMNFKKINYIYTINWWIIFMNWLFIFFLLIYEYY